MDFFRIIKKGDIILFISLLTVSFLMLFFLHYKTVNALPASTVLISKDGRPYGSYSIYDNKTVDTGSNVIVIDKGEVYMKCSDCKNQICVHTGHISRPGQTIICLPNRIVVEIKGGSSYDAVSR